MKFTAAVALTVALRAAAQRKCYKTSELINGTQPDPLKPFVPGSANFPCDMGAAIPLGKVPTGCSKLEIIVARGTSEPGQLGQVVGDPVVARVKRDLPGVDVRGYPVQYPASLAGSQTGIADIGKRLAQENKECPDEKFALVGYSQGGMVVLSALAAIPAEISKKVVAIILYGAGDGSVVTGSYKDKVLANCAPGDFACPNAGSGPGHVSYNNEGTKWHDRTSQYIIEAFKGKSLGKKLVRSPTDALV